MENNPIQVTKAGKTYDPHYAHMLEPPFCIFCKAIKVNVEKGDKPIYFMRNKIQMRGLQKVGHTRTYFLGKVMPTGFIREFCVNGNGKVLKMERGV